MGRSRGSRADLDLTRFPDRSQVPTEKSSEFLKVSSFHWFRRVPNRKMFKSNVPKAQCEVPGAKVSRNIQEQGNKKQPRQFMQGVHDIRPWFKGVAKSLNKKSPFPEVQGMKVAGDHLDLCLEGVLQLCLVSPIR